MFIDFIAHQMRKQASEPLLRIYGLQRNETSCDDYNFMVVVARSEPEARQLAFDYADNHDMAWFEESETTSNDYGPAESITPKVLMAG